jgi:hypothetical protein
VLGREKLVGRVSRGEYSKVALVRAVLRDTTTPVREAH